MFTKLLLPGIFLFLFLTPSLSHSQTHYTVTLSNYETVADNIYNSYGSTINITAEDIKDYFHSQLTQFSGQDIGSPNFSLAANGFNEILFTWNDIIDAKFQFGYLNLMLPGDNLSFKTSKKRLNVTLAQSIAYYLFSLIGGDGTVKSSLDIIIVERDIFYTSTLSRATRPNLIATTNPFCAPNPAENTTNLNFSLSHKQAINITLYSAIGQRIQQVLQNTTLQAGEHQVRIDCSQLRAGTYYCRIQTDKGIQTIPIVKVVDQ